MPSQNPQASAELEAKLKELRLALWLCRAPWIMRIMQRSRRRFFECTLPGSAK